MEDRPDWCPHPECLFLMNSQDMVCTGKLPEQTPHDNDFNTHRICFDTRETHKEVFDLQINKTDSWHFKRHMENILNPTTP